MLPSTSANLSGGFGPLHFLPGGQQMFLVVGTRTIRGYEREIAYSIHHTEAEAEAEIRWVHARRDDLKDVTFAIWSGF